MKNKFLIVIDTQNDFIDGSLKNENAIKKVPNIVERLKKVKDEENVIGILVTQDTHSEDYLNTLEGKKLPVPHCIKNTKGWEINSQIKEVLDLHAPYVTYFEKPTFGCSELGKEIKKLIGSSDNENAENEYEIEIFGFVTSICVISNAIILREAFPNMKISLNSNCSAGLTDEDHNAALTVAQMCQIDII